MLQRHSILIGILLAVVFLLIAVSLYPGGSLTDKNSVGFSWTKNFFCNLFNSKAMNGADNPARFWADTGVIIMSVSYAVFFIQFSKRIPGKSAPMLIKYCGVAGMVATFLIVTPLHDLMVIIAGTLVLLSIFYITVFVLRSQLHFFKFLCILCLLIFYFTLYLYGAGKLVLLAIMQKVTFLTEIILILLLHYFTKKDDFIHIKTAASKK